LNKTPVSLAKKEWWWEKDSNLRRRKPADLQSALVGHLSIPPQPANQWRAQDFAR